MNSELHSCLSGSTLFLLVFLGLLLGQVHGEDFGTAESYAGAGPDLMVSSVYGNLELGRPSSIFVVVKNGAEPAAGEDEMSLGKDAARSISADLISSDERIRVLSRPQLAGLLAGGESTTLQ